MLSNFQKTHPHMNGGHYISFPKIWFLVVSVARGVSHEPHHHRLERNTLKIKTRYLTGLIESVR
jgi:hypothetical protein